MEKRSNFGKKAILTDSRKMILSVLLVSMAVFLVTGAFAESDPGKLEDGMPDYNIIVGVNNHDHQNLDDLFIHRCAITPPIVATCLIYAVDKNGDQILSEVEYLISRDQYLQIPYRDRQNWHNHATELTPERGEPACISLPDGFECGAVVDILKTTYGKPVMLWDPSDALPSYQPYVYDVESTFALKQDLNNNLHNEWSEGDESTSSFGILNEIPGEDEEPTCELPGELELDYRSVNTGSIVELLGITEFEDQNIDYFRGDLELEDNEIDGRGRFRIDGTTVEGDDFRWYVSRIDANEIVGGDCNSVTWEGSGRGDLRGLPGGTQRIDFDVVTTYDFNTGEINAVGYVGEEVAFRFENMEDNNF